MTKPVSANKKLSDIADRMLLFFVGTKLTCASQDVVEKWAREIKESVEGEVMDGTHNREEEQRRQVDPAGYCAHQRVNYDPIEHGNERYTSRWTCAGL